MGMPWHSIDPMFQRHEFVLLAEQPGVNIRELCRRTGISAKTGYKWLARFRSAREPEALQDRCRRPHRSPERCDSALAAVIVAMHEQTTWGGRKLRHRLLQLGFAEVPAASTCTEILRRAGCLDRERPPSRPLQRFQRAQPNELWQMDFKGHFATQSGPRCHPLTVLDDHSRFNLTLEAAADQTGLTVQRALSATFSLYGLPEAILCDNGSPWGASEPVCPHTSLTAWLLRLGVRVIHGRPYHPQTQGKEERFHRTLHQECISQHTWRDLHHCAQRFTHFRQRYNCERPHDAHQGDTPVRHYQPSPRRMPSVLPLLEYCSETTVKIVRSAGFFTFHNQTWYAGRPFAGLAIGLRPSAQADGKWEVWFAHHLLGHIDLRLPLQPKHTLRSIYQP
jgi:transposase InsO family protein